MNKLLLISAFVLFTTSVLLGQRLDSIHQKAYDAPSSSLYTTYRTIFEYDEDNHPIVKRRYEWQRNEKVWAEVKREHYEHDKKGLLTGRYEENYSSFLGEWLRSNKRGFTYDNKDRRVTKTTSIWSKTAKVWNEKAVDSTFYSDGEILRKTYSLIATNGPVLETSRARRNYDSQGRLIARTILGKQTTDGPWLDKYQTRYEFGTEGQLLSITEVEINLNSTSIKTTLEYTYDKELRITSIGSYYGSNKVLDYRDDYSYSGDTVVKENWRWDERFNEVVRDYKTIEVLDDSGRVELITSLGYDLDKKEYFNMDKHTNTYNQFDTIKYFVRETWKSGLWEPFYAYRYFHSKNPVSVEQTSKTATVFPNPAKNIIRISGFSPTLSTFEIFSVSGIKVLSTQVRDGGIIPVNSLEHGYYICRIQSEGEIYQAKFLKW